MDLAIRKLFFESTQNQTKKRTDYSLFSENGHNSPTNGVNFVGLQNLHQYMRQNRASILPFGAISIAVCSILPFAAMQPPSEDVQMQASGIGAPLDHLPPNASSDQRVRANTNGSNSTTSSDEEGGLLQKNKNNKQRHQGEEDTRKSNLTKKAAHFAPFSGNKFKEVDFFKYSIKIETSYEQRQKDTVV